MIEHVNSLEEAREWFLKNSSGVVICVSGDREQECRSYPEAVAFYAAT